VVVGEERGEGGGGAGGAAAGAGGAGAGAGGAGAEQEQEQVVEEEVDEGVCKHARSDSPHMNTAG